MIKAVIFDYGGVISDGGAGIEVTSRLASNLAISKVRATELWDLVWSNFMKGKIDEDELWKRVEAAYGKPINVSHRQVFNTWEHMLPRPEVMELVDQLKNHGYIVGMLSNVVPPTEAIIRREGAYQIFKPCILSCNLGFAKPDQEIYDELLRQLPGLKPSEILFIDDNDYCLTPAEAMGILTIRATDVKQIVSDVKEAIRQSS